MVSSTLLDTNLSTSCSLAWNVLLLMAASFSLSTLNLMSPPSLTTQSEAATQPFPKESASLITAEHVIISHSVLFTCLSVCVSFLYKLFKSKELDCFFSLPFHKSNAQKHFWKNEARADQEGGRERAPTFRASPSVLLNFGPWCTRGLLFTNPTNPRAFPFYRMFKTDVTYLKNEMNMKELNKIPMG